MLQIWCEIYPYSVLQENTVISIVDDIACICMMLKVVRAGCPKSLFHNFNTWCNVTNMTIFNLYRTIYKYILTSE